MRTRIDENAHASKLHQCRGGMMIFSCTRKLLLDRAITLPAVAGKCRHAVRMKLKISAAPTTYRVQRLSRSAPLPSPQNGHVSGGAPLFRCASGRSARRHCAHQPYSIRLNPHFALTPCKGLQTAALSVALGLNMIGGRPVFVCRTMCRLDQCAFCHRQTPKCARDAT